MSFSLWMSGPPCGGPVEPPTPQLPSQVKGRVSKRGWKNSQSCLTSRVSRFHWGSSKQPGSRYVSVCSIKKTPTCGHIQSQKEDRVLWSFDLGCAAQQKSPLIKSGVSTTQLQEWIHKWKKVVRNNCEWKMMGSKAILRSPSLFLPLSFWSFHPDCCRSWFLQTMLTGAVAQ